MDRSGEGRRARHGVAGWRLLGPLALAALALGGMAPGLGGCGAASAEGGAAVGGAVARERDPSGSTLSGTGCVSSTSDAAADRASADERARADVAKQIRVRVVQVVQDMEREEKQSGREAAGSYSISVETREVVDRNLEGVRIVERRRDPPPGMTCSVAMLDKAAMAARIREQLERTLQEVEAHGRAAGEADRGRHPTEALRERSLALRALGTATVQAGLLRDLGYAPPAMPVRAGLLNAWTDALQEIQVVAAGGDGQRARPGRPLSEPLRVRVCGAGGVPAVDLPLKVHRAPDGLEMQRSARTDSAGEAALPVVRVPPGREAVQQVVLGVDWDRLLAGKDESSGEAPWSRWDVREAVLTYRVPIPADYRVGVAVYDADGGQALVRSPVQSALQEGLQQTGFVTRDIFALPGGLLQVFQRKPTLEEARKSLGGKVDILVLGDVSVAPPRRSSYDLVFCRSRMSVHGIDLSTGRTLFSLEVGGKGGGLDNSTATRKALEDLGKKLRKAAGPKLADALP